MSRVTIRPLLDTDIAVVAQMEHAAWHQYYSQYSIYEIIKDSVSLEGLLKEWREFLEPANQTTGPLIVGQDRHALVAIVQGQIAAIGAVSGYVQGKWPEVDAMLRSPGGALQKTAKFQELYVRPNMRGKGLGHHLSIARADLMLEKGYSAIFLTTFADAHRTIDFHEKNGLAKVHEYMSLQTYDGNKQVRIACFLDKNLQAYRDRLANELTAKIGAGKALQ